MKKNLLFLVALLSFQIAFATDDIGKKETAPPISQPVTNVFLLGVVVTNPIVGINNEDTNSGVESPTNTGTDPRDSTRPEDVAVTPSDFSSPINTIRELDNSLQVTATGIESAEQIAANIGVYPNPATDYLQIRLNKPMPDCQVYLVNTTGQIVTPIYQGFDTNLVQIELHQLPTGMYIMVIGTTTQQQTYKIQVCH